MKVFFALVSDDPTHYWNATPNQSSSYAPQRFALLRCYWLKSLPSCSGVSSCASTRLVHVKQDAGSFHAHHEFAHGIGAKPKKVTEADPL